VAVRKVTRPPVPDDDSDTEVEIDEEGDKLIDATARAITGGESGDDDSVYKPSAKRKSQVIDGLIHEEVTYNDVPLTSDVQETALHESVKETIAAEHLAGETVGQHYSLSDKYVDNLAEKKHYPKRMLEAKEAVRRARQTWRKEVVRWESQKKPSADSRSVYLLKQALNDAKRNRHDIFAKYSREIELRKSDGISSVRKIDDAPSRRGNKAHYEIRANFHNYKGDAYQQDITISRKESEALFRKAYIDAVDRMASFDGFLNLDGSGILYDQSLVSFPKVRDIEYTRDVTEEFIRQIKITTITVTGTFIFGRKKVRHWRNPPLGKTIFRFGRQDVLTKKTLEPIKCTKACAESILPPGATARFYAGLKAKMGTQLNAFRKDPTVDGNPNTYKLGTGVNARESTFERRLTFSLNVSNDGYIYQSDTRQIYALGCRQLSPDQLQWFGRIRKRIGYDIDDVDGEENSFLEIPLDNEWVEENFASVFLDVVKDASEKKRNFVIVPPGNVQAPMENVIIAEDSPRIAFSQKSLSCCATSGFASALHYLGYIQKSQDLHNLGLDWLKTENVSRIMESTVQWFRNTSPMRYEWQCLRMKAEQQSPEALLKLGMVHFMFVQLLATDSSAGHSITIYCGQVFDSNNERALPLNRETLDYCCGSNLSASTRCSFLKVFRGYLFERVKKRKA
jgi:hypothetical protein